jgi:glycosyltransferase involved in cell wall biosynthesis
MKRVLLIVPSMTCGGAERVVSLLSLRLEEEVFLAVFDNSEGEFFEHRGELIDLKTPRGGGVFRKFCNLVVRVRRLGALKRELGIDVAISFMEGPNIVNLLSKREEKTIISARNRVKSELLKPLARLAISRLYNRADRFIALSRGVMEDYIRTFRVNREIAGYIYNPVMIERVRELKEERSDFENLAAFPVVCNIGRLTRQKGQFHLIRIFRRVKELVRDARLIFIGDGELRDDLIRLAENCGLEVFSVWRENERPVESYDVFFLGFQENPFKYLRISSLFAFPSIYEGLGNVLLESMACAVPIVSSDCRWGPREILAPDSDYLRTVQEQEMAAYGVLMPVCDGNFYQAEEALTGQEGIWAEGVAEMLGNHDRSQRYARAGFRRAQDFCTDAIAKQWASLIREHS